MVEHITFSPMGIKRYLKSDWRECYLQEKNDKERYNDPQAWSQPPFPRDFLVYKKLLKSHFIHTIAFQIVTCLVPLSKPMSEHIFKPRSLSYKFNINPPDYRGSLNKPVQVLVTQQHELYETLCNRISAQNILLQFFKLVLKHLQSFTHFVCVCVYEI